MSINTVSISGRAVKDPELRVTASGMSVLSMTVVVNERVKNRDSGQYEDYANFLDCTVFGKKAEFVQRHVCKGTLVSVCGKLHQSKWTDKESGKGRSKIEIIADEVDFQPTKGEHHQVEQAAQSYSPFDLVSDDDIPF